VARVYSRVLSLLLLLLLARLSPLAPPLQWHRSSSRPLALAPPASAASSMLHLAKRSPCSTVTSFFCVTSRRCEPARAGQQDAPCRGSTLQQCGRRARTCGRDVRRARRARGRHPRGRAALWQGSRCSRCCMHWGRRLRPSALRSACIKQNEIQLKGSAVVWLIDGSAHK